MKKIIVIAIFLTVQTALFGQFKSLQEQVDYYESRYKVSCDDEKITDNFGNGFDF